MKISFELLTGLSAASECTSKSGEDMDIICDSGCFTISPNPSSDSLLRSAASSSASGKDCRLKRTAWMFESIGVLDRLSQAWIASFSIGELEPCSSAWIASFSIGELETCSSDWIASFSIGGLEPCSSAWIASFSVGKLELCSSDWIASFSVGGIEIWFSSRSVTVSTGFCVSGMTRTSVTTVSRIWKSLIEILNDEERNKSIILYVPEILEA